MRKFLFLLFLILFFKIDVYGQFAYGTTGLLHMPTAEMQKDKTFMFGGSVLNPETLPSKEWWGNYYTFNYYLNITIFPWLEVGYNCVLVKGKTGIYHWPNRQALDARPHIFSQSCQALPTFYSLSSRAFR